MRPRRTTAPAKRGALAVLTALIVTLGGCGDDTSPGTPPTPTAPAPARAETPAPAATKNPSPSPLKLAEAAVTGQMQHHFAAVKNVERAIVDGDLEAAHRAAGVLLDERPDAYPADWAPYLYALREAGEAVRNADALTGAAAATGRLSATCGRCHSALGRGPQFAVPDEPPACDPDSPEGMLAHAWAVEQMWRGVVGPDEAAWRRGAKRFSELPTCLPGAQDEGLEHEAIRTLRGRVVELASEATEADTLDRRAAIYGEYLGACASCHVSGC